MSDTPESLRKFDQSHLDCLLSGVDAWNDTNSLAQAHLEGANLSKAHLDGANLKRAHLNGANLKDANLNRAQLDGAFLLDAHLEGANLGFADLKGAFLRKAHLEGANLRGAHLDGAYLLDAHLDGADLCGAHLEGAYLGGAQLKGAKLVGTFLTDADLRGSKSLRLDATFVRDARFDSRAKDPWSTLRSNYTGPRLLFIVFFAVLFFLPYVVKLGYWHTVNGSQEHTKAQLENIRQRGVDAGLDASQIDALGLSDQGIGNNSLCLADSCVSRPTWYVGLGVDHGVYFWFPAVVLIFYNILRALLTYLLAPMRDAEERSGYSPAWDGKPWETYRYLFFVHRVVFWLGVFAFMAFLWNAQHWLSEPVWIPAAEVSQ